MRFFGAVIAGACIAAGASPALAAGSGSPPPGVHIDPGSPAGKQYVIPIVAARSETSSGGNSSAPAGIPTSGGPGDPPLFGAGVTPPAANTGSSRARGGHLKKRAARRHLASPSHTPIQPHPAPAIPSSVTAPANSSAWLALAGGGALVLLLGGGGGLALRRRLSP